LQAAIARRAESSGAQELPACAMWAQLLRVALRRALLARRCFEMDRWYGAC
jgi:hypothetical protein